MTTDTQVSNLVINKLTKEQYEAIETPSDTELWLVEDDNSGGYHPPLLSCMWSDHILNEMSWLRADTFSWQSGDVYKAVYEELENEWNDWWATHTPEQCEQIPNIYPIRSSKGYLICGADREQAIINAYNSTGVAWYYILDKENRRFKLPRTKYGFTGLRDSVGNYVPESLPNISGRFTGLLNHINFQGDGAFVSTKADDYISGYINDTGNYNSNIQNTFLDASRLSSTYQNNAPVQQRATQMYLYFYVGEFSQTATEQTAGITTEVLNSKADISASNLNAQGKSLISGLGMPSNRYIDLTLGASGATYTAPANGYFYVLGSNTDLSCYLLLINTTKEFRNMSWMYATAGNANTCYLPVSKNDVFRLDYWKFSPTLFRFIYAEGEN